MNYLGALTAGYTVEQVLNYLSKNFPELGPRIKEAVQSGKNPKDILNYLGKFDHKQLSRLKSNRKSFEPFPDAGMSNPHIQGNQAIKEYNPIPESIQKGAKIAAPIALTSAIAPKLGSMAAEYLPHAAKVFQNALPKNILQPELLKQQLQGLPNESQTMPSPSQNQLNTSQQPPANQVAASIPEPANIQQPKVISNPKEYLEKAGVIGDVDRMLKEKNTPEAIAATIGLKTGKGKVAGKVDPELLKNIEEYAALPKESESQNLPKSTELVEEKPVEPVKIEKKSIVSSPQGIGEVKEIRNGQAIIDVDGKLHKVKEEDLEPPLYSDDEIADAYDNLMEKIPEKERSGFISWAGYDEDRNVLGYIPRGGKYEEIDDITPEEAKAIKEGTGTARTSGEVREGLWTQGGETRGGIISQIYWDRKKKREAEENKQGKFNFDLPKPEKQDRGMKPQFDEMAYARNLSRAREKRAKDEERARKKKEKDEAKKRKK
jgi:hypothetical protein